MGFTDNEREETISSLKKYLASIKTDIRELKSGYDLEINEDYSQIVLKFDAKLSKQDQADFVYYTVCVCMILQELELENENPYLSLNIYDSSTGRLVSRGDTLEGIQWNIGGK